jgi:VWFA-related protein
VVRGVVLLSAVVSVGGLFGQEVPRFEERVEVHLVNLEVNVTTRREPVTGLSADDFELFENGQRMEISHFEEFSPAKLEGDGSNEPQQPRGFLIIFIDETPGTIHDAVRSSLQKSLVEIARTVSADGIAVMMVVWADTLEVHLTPTTDLSKIEHAVNVWAKNPTLVALQRLGRIRAEALMKNDSTLYEMRERRRYFAVLNAMATVLRNAGNDGGRKSLLFVGRGFSHSVAESGNQRPSQIGERETGEGEPAVRNPFRVPLPDERPEIGRAFEDRWLNSTSATRMMSRSANRAGVTMYGIYGGGLAAALPAAGGHRAGLPSHVAASLTSLNVIAHETGGVAMGTTNVTRGILGQIHRDLTHYYTIAYRTRSDGEGAIRKIELRLKKGRSGRLRYRREVILEPSSVSGG